MDGVAALHVVVAAVGSAAVSGDRAGGLGNPNQICVRGQLDRTDIAAAGNAQALIGSRDVAGNLCTGNAVCSQPSGILQIHRGSAAGKGIEVFHVPVAAHILRAFQLFDDLAHGKLARGAAPYLVVGIAAVKSHEGIGMPQHPAQRVHGACLIPHTGSAAIRGVGHEGIHVHQHIGAFGALILAGALAGTGEIVFQAEYREALQIVRRSIDRAMRGGFRQLRIVAVLTGAAVQARLPGIEAANRAVNVLQRKAVHRRSLEHPSSAVSGLLEIFQRVGKVSDSTAFFSGFAGFIQQNPAGSVIRPLHRAILEIVAVEEAHLIPDMAGFIEIDCQNLNGRVLHEVAQIFAAVISFSCLCINTGKHTGFGGDADIGPGCFIGRLIVNFRGFLLRHFRFSRKIFRGLSAFLRILCRFRIRRRLILHGLLRFIRRGFLFGSRLFCQIGFRQWLVFHQISRKLSLFRIGFDRFLCCSAYWFFLFGRSIHRLFHNLWICLSSRIASVHQEQTHHANRSFSLSYREEADILDVLIQQVFLVQILH